MLPWRWLLFQYCEGRQTWMHHYNPKGKNKALNTGTSIHRNPKNSKPNALHKTSFDSVLGVVTVLHTLCDTTWNLNLLWILSSTQTLKHHRRRVFYNLLTHWCCNIVMLGHTHIAQPRLLCSWNSYTFQSLYIHQIWCPATYTSLETLRTFISPQIIKRRRMQWSHGSRKDCQNSALIGWENWFSVGSNVQLKMETTLFPIKFISSYLVTIPARPSSSSSSRSKLHFCKERCSFAKLY